MTPWVKSQLYANLIMLGILFLVIALIARAIKKSSDRNYELRKYQAETERIKAEAMRKERAKE